MGYELPNCSATLRINQLRHSFYCEYCGTQINDVRLGEAENESKKIEIRGSKLKTSQEEWN